MSEDKRRDGVEAGCAPDGKGFAGAVEVLKGLLGGRGCAYEMFFVEDEGIGAESKDGGVDALKARRGHGVGLRVIRGRRPGFAYASTFEKDALKELVDRALAASDGADEDEALFFPAPPPTYPEVRGICDEAGEGEGAEAVIEKAMLAEKGAMDVSDEIRRVRKASFDSRSIRTRVINSEGVDAAHRATYYTAQVMAVAERGDEAQMGWDMGLSHRGSDIDAMKVGRDAAERALRLLGAETIKTARLPAVLENTVVCELLEALSGSFLGDNLFKGKSMLRDRAGKKVFSDIINIWDDGLLEGGWGTAPSDAEGMPMEKTCLVERGVLKGYLFDSYWAARMHARSTGNASRPGYAASPGVGVTNLYMDPAPSAGSLEDLFGEAGRGLFITELMGVHTINPVTGDFSLGAGGLWIEGGELRHPVRGLAVAGNLLELFEKVVATAGDTRFLGSVGAPSILISELEASGS
jgi:PmbA protein